MVCIKEKKTDVWYREAIYVCIYGPHLMIVMVFVTKNNFQNGPGISDCPFGFYQSRLKMGTISEEQLREKIVNQLPSPGQWS